MEGPFMRILDGVSAWLVRRATNRALARIRERHGMAIYQESLAALERASAGRSETPPPVPASPDRAAIGDDRLPREPARFLAAEEHDDIGDVLRSCDASEGRALRRLGA
jgi:DNA-directed RNA polymerase specialized sigma24 family protein